MDVRLPDGTVIQNVPEGITKAELTVRLARNGYDVSALQADEPKKDKTSLADDIKQSLGNIAAGAVRGAGSIGATILSPIDAAARAAGVQNEWIGRSDRRQAMDEGLKSLGAETDSIGYNVGKLGAEVAGTAGVGGVLANGARAVGAAPAIVSSIASGGFRAGQTTGAANALVRALGGGVTGAGSAALVDPAHTGTGAVIGAALPGVAKAGGMLGEKIVSASKGASNKLMQSAIKPTIAELKTGQADAAIRTLLDYGISPTKAGVNKLRDLVDDLNTQIADKIGSSSAQISKKAVVNRLADVEGMFSKQVAPTADLNAIRGVADDFLGHPVFIGDSIPVQAAQELKQGTYRALAKKYGQIGGAETEAAKGLARGLKEEIAEAVPGVGALNAEESRLLGALSVAERRALMDLNKNPMGLAALATDPTSWAAFMADRSVAFKSMAARLLNRTANAAPDAGNLLLRGADNPLLRSSAIAIAGRE